VETALGQANLTATVTSGPTALNYAYNDGVDDTAVASFTVTSDDSSVNLSIDMLTAVRRACVCCRALPHYQQRQQRD
jgi:hypothetical protein